MMLLPTSLFALVQSFLVLVEAQSQTLSLDTVVDLNGGSLPNPPTFGLPSSSRPIYVSVALCANSGSPPRFFISNNTALSQPGPSDVNNVDVFELSVSSEGFGNWAGMFTNGGTLSVLKGTATTPFEILLSATNSEHPFLGDTTSNQALLFSPPFAPPPMDQPTFPNYTLPPANLTFPSEPTSPPQYSLVFASTSLSALKTLPRTRCAIQTAARQANSNVTVLEHTTSQGMWLRDSNGWRWQWFVQGLNPNTNYTAFMLQIGQVASSRSINFVTKSAFFNCPIAHSLTFCPGISYAVPLAAPNAPATSYTVSNVPSDLSNTIISTMANFTATLTTLACGRDHYSPLVSCSDCQSAYRTWLCAVSFPRCGEASSTGASASTSGDDSQVPLPALQSVPAGATPRNPVLPVFGSTYTTLLPCLETCNGADRACPAFLGFKCPLPRFTAAHSYGVGFIDSAADGQVGQGTTSTAQDVYGNVWCNAG